jgi:hypothetical protein
MRIEFDSDGTITIFPDDSIDEYCLERWLQENDIGCDKIKIETRRVNPLGFRKKNYNEQDITYE